MTNEAQKLLIKLGLDAELAERFSVSPELVCDELRLDAETRKQILQLSEDGDDDKVIPFSTTWVIMVQLNDMASKTHA
ncbi:hypothetical protein FCL40_12165 [Ferrimonas sediminicola]|uniref:Uncharacterized protein n=1 Tax=Ferrimonas sediminicola TaxID=2569538 RepID=A0A4U1BDR5_9GAMM|nr:hypothetical protein [Ferrimonas sediminicola]TKB48459.1 hypothetical protein FCL40_12165 [Ferrimonas sediminicola]